MDVMLRTILYHQKDNVCIIYDSIIYRIRKRKQRLSSAERKNFGTAHFLLEPN